MRELASFCLSQISTTLMFFYLFIIPHFHFLFSIPTAFTFIELLLLSHQDYCIRILNCRAVVLGQHLSHLGICSTWKFWVFTLDALNQELWDGALQSMF